MNLEVRNFTLRLKHSVLWGWRVTVIHSRPSLEPGHR
jgi:hypothetical protein